MNEKLPTNNSTYRSCPPSPPPPTQAQTRTHTHTHITHTHACMQACTCMHAQITSHHIHTHARTHACTHARTHTQAAHAHTHTRTHARPPACMHAHTLWYLSSSVFIIISFCCPSACQKHSSPCAACVARKTLVHDWPWSSSDCGQLFSTHSFSIWPVMQ